MCHLLCHLVEAQDPHNRLISMINQAIFGGGNGPYVEPSPPLTREPDRCSGESHRRFLRQAEDFFP